MLKAKTDEENKKTMIKTMTNEEIKKALTCCNGTYEIKKCGECPMKDVNGCYEALLKCALDLVNRQDTENERLKRKLNKAERCIWDIEYASEKSATNDRIIEAIEEYNRGDTE